MSNAIDYGRIKILLIEDDAYTRSIIRTQLQVLGMRDIEEAANGKDGLVALVRVRPHLVLCDVHMDTMDGLAFLKALRELKIEALRDTPVIFLTADAQSDTVLFAKEHAISGYLVKPVTGARLKAHIDALTDKLGLS